MPSRSLPVFAARPVFVRDEEIKPHPAAEIFPLMTGADFEALVADIRDNGQREPIIVHDGLILDGRNRYRACRQIGTEAETLDWNGKGSPEAFVISMNLHRRHLNESQRSMIAGRLATLRQGQRADCAVPEISGTRLKQAEAAELLNVCPDTVRHARKVLTEGTAEEIAAVDRGEVAASTIAKQIRKGASPEKRKANRKAPLAQAGKNPERIQRAQMKAELWARLSDALIGLTSLPLPADVAEIVGGHPNRTKVVEERLARSLQWLKDFDHAWRNRG